MNNTRKGNVRKKQPNAAKKFLDDLKRMTELKRARSYAVPSNEMDSSVPSTSGDPELSDSPPLPDLPYLGCLCRLRECIENDKIWTSNCQAVDTIGDDQTTDYTESKCDLAVHRKSLIRPHCRHKLQSYCDDHRNRMLVHQCCSTCGKFIRKGIVYQCQDSDPPHLFHDGSCNYLNRCVHCFSPKIRLGYINLETNVVGNFTTSAGRASNPFVPEGICFEPRMARHFCRIPGTSFEICTFYLSDESDCEKIRQAVRQATLMFTSNMASVIKNNYFFSAVALNNLGQAIFCLAKEYSVDSIFMETIYCSKDTVTKPPHSINRALPWAVYYDYHLLTFVLIQAGADVNRVDSEGKNPLMWAAAKGRRSVVSMLLRAGTNLTTTVRRCSVVSSKEDKNANTVLHLAAVQGDPEVVKIIAQVCCNGKQSNFGKRFSSTTSVPISERLALINAQNKFGETPLMLAAQNNHDEALLHLLYYGASTSFTDKVITEISVVIPAHQAYSRNNEIIYNFFRKAILPADSTSTARAPN